MTIFSKLRKNKFRNERCVLDGHSFQSKLEASVYQLLKLRGAAKEIERIGVQTHIYLTDARILYIPDFQCVTANGDVFYVEAKGFEGERWPTIKKLWKFYGPAPLEIWKGNFRNPKLIEIIVPVCSKSRY